MLITIFWPSTFNTKIKGPALILRRVHLTAKTCVLYPAYYLHYSIISTFTTKLRCVFKIDFDPENKNDSIGCNKYSGWTQSEKGSAKSARSLKNPSFPKVIVSVTASLRVY